MKKETQKKNRDPKLVIILGFPGCGKSTLIKKFIKSYLDTGRRSLVCTPHFDDFSEFKLIENNTEIVQFDGVRKNFTYDLNDVTNVINHYRKGLLTFDDCRYYFPSNSDGIVKQLMLSRRHWMVDIIVAAHGFTEVPPKFFTYASEIILFKTKTDIIFRYLF